jgi:hypothetical protein
MIRIAATAGDSPRKRGGKAVATFIRGTRSLRQEQDVNKSVAGLPGA